MFCSIHTSREALGSCVSCGRGVCLDCLEKKANRLYCSNCAQSPQPGLARLNQLEAVLSLERTATIVTTKNRYLAAIVAFTFGWVGGHKYYVGQWGWGLMYTLFFWTGIPTLASIVEALLYLVRSESDFVRRYGLPENHSNPSIFMPPVKIDYERQLLQFARRHNGQISMALLMADSQMDLEKAEEALARLAAKGLVQSEITHHGQVLYTVPDFRQIPDSL